MSHQHATLEDTVYFWFASNDTSGSGGDGASAVADVREAGAAAGAAAVLSPSPTLLSHADFPAGCYEVAVAATAVNGFAADKTYGVFCSLTVDSQNPSGFIGSVSLFPVSADIAKISGDATAADNAELAFDGTGYGFTNCVMPTITTYTGNTPQTADHTAGIADIPTVAEFNARTLAAASYFDPSADTVATVTAVTNGVTLAAGAVTNESLSGNMEIVFETDFATNYNITRNAWVTNYTDYLGTIPAAALGADCITSAKIADDAISSEHLNTGALTADAFAADALVAATFATNAIAADGLAADAVAEIQSGLATPTNITAGTITTVTNLTNTVTLANGAHGGAAASFVLADYSDFTGAGAENPNVLLSAEVATVTSQTEFTLATGSDEDDAYNDQAIVLYDDTNSDYPSVRKISDYVGSTKTVTIDSGADFTLGTDDSVRIFVTAPGTTAPTAAAIRTEIDSNSTQLALIVADTSELQTDDVPTLIAALPTAAENRTELDSNSTQLALIVADTNELQGDWVNTGRLDAILDTVAADVVNIDGAAMRGTDSAALESVCTEGRLAELDAANLPADVDEILADTNELQTDDVPSLIAALDVVVDRVEADTQDIQTQVGTAGAGLTDLGGMSTGMKAEVNAEADTALGDYDGPTNAEMEARTPTAAQLIYIVSNAATGMPVTFTTAGGSTTAAVLNQVDGASGSATDDQYNGRLLVFTDGTLKGVVTDITDYTGSTTTATITAIPTAPTSSHNARLI